MTRTGGPCPEAFVVFAASLADAAGPVLRRHFRAGIAVETKADASPVTAADREVEAEMRRRIEASWPDHGILGEEYGATRADAEYLWVLDPLDGTKAFVAGKPLFGTLIALLHDGVPILGIIDAPVLRERWVGSAGRPTSFNGTPVTTRRGIGLGASMVNTTTPDMFRGARWAAFDRLREAVGTCQYGGDCYGYGLLASGFVDLVVEAAMKPYDHLPLVCVVEGAGGVITDWSGAPLTSAGDGTVLAAGDPAVHAEAMRRLAG